jgi:hypothetical protein
MVAVLAVSRCASVGLALVYFLFVLGRPLALFGLKRLLALVSPLCEEMSIDL